MCDEAVDDCPGELKFIPDCFVTKKILKKFHDALLANDDILFLIKILGNSNSFLMKWVFLV